MDGEIAYQDEQDNRGDGYLGMIHTEHGAELVTPDVVYKLSLMALDELTLSFLGFYDYQPEDLGSVALLKKVQEIVYIDDRIVEELSRMVTGRDRGILAGNVSEPVTPRQAFRMVDCVLHVFDVLNPYLPA